jgi:mycothiol synthase
MMPVEARPFSTPRSESSPLPLPDAPAIPGLVYRRFRGEPDYPQMVAILDACNDADGLEYANSVEEIAFVFSHLTNCDPYQDMLFAEVDGQAIAFSRVWWKELGTGERLYPLLGFVHPAWRRKGLGRAMLRYDERRLREIARGHPSGMPKFYHAWATDAEAGAQALFGGAGYRVERTFVEMTRPIDRPPPDTPLPMDLEVRPVREAQIRRIWEAREEVYRDHWGYAPASEAGYQRWREDAKFDPSLWQVAWEGEQVAGMVLNRINRAENAKYQRKRGYTQDVFVRRPWRRRGLARALLVQSILMFREMGMAETALGVDTENPSGALALYESVGYRPARRHTFYGKVIQVGF